MSQICGSVVASIRGHLTGSGRTTALLALAKHLRDVDAQLDLLTIRCIEQQRRDREGQQRHCDQVRDRMFREAAANGLDLLPIRRFFYPNMQ
jgi:hypothetical protein